MPDPNDPFARIAYDQTDPLPPEAGPPAGMPADDSTAGLDPLAAAEQTAQAPAPMLSQLGAADQAPTTDQLTGDQLGALVGDQGATPEDLQAQELEAALNDPNTPPEEKAQIEAMIALAARRSLAGVGGPPA